MMIYIKEWFFNRMRLEDRNLHLYYEAVQVIRETEKAYQVIVEYTTIDGEYDGTKHMWVPKSCTMTEEEYNTQEAERGARFEAGCNAYNEMIKFAKEHGVKGVRSGMKKTTILSKIKAAGLEYAA